MLIKQTKRSVDLRDINFKLGKVSGGTFSTNLSNQKVDTREIVDCVTITTSNITLSGNQTINGVTTINGSVVLVNAQTDPKDNGIYISDASSWGRVSNDLNDIKLIKIIDGDFNSYFYTLLNEPIEIGVSDINYSVLFEPNQSTILSTTLTFDTADLNTGSGAYFELMPGVSGKSILCLSMLLEVTTSGATCSGNAIIKYENAAGFIYTLTAGNLAGTDTRYAEVVKYDGTANNVFNLGDGIGFDHPALTATGTINGTLHLTYRLI